MDLDPTQPVMPRPSSLRAHHRFWPSRLPHAITPPATSLWDNLETSARRYPHKAALATRVGIAVAAAEATAARTTAAVAAAGRAVRCARAASIARASVGPAAAVSAARRGACRRAASAAAVAVAAIATCDATVAACA